MNERAGTAPANSPAYVLTIDNEGGAAARARKELVELGLKGCFVMGATKGGRKLLELYNLLKNLILSKRSLTVAFHIRLCSA